MGESGVCEESCFKCDRIFKAGLTEAELWFCRRRLRRHCRRPRCCCCCCCFVVGVGVGVVGVGVGIGVGVGVGVGGFVVLLGCYCVVVCCCVLFSVAIINSLPLPAPSLSTFFLSVRWMRGGGIRGNMRHSHVGIDAAAATSVATILYLLLLLLLLLLLRHFPYRIASCTNFVKSYLVLTVHSYGNAYLCPHMLLRRQ